MKINRFVILLGSLLCSLPSLFNACALCIGHLDRENKTPAFFSEQYDSQWQLNHDQNSRLLKELESENQ